MPAKSQAQRRLMAAAKHGADFPMARVAPGAERVAVMMMRRDARGRFRKPTDEERWPDPDERATMQRIRTYFQLAQAAYMDGMAARLDDIKALRGKVWDAAV